MYSSLPGSAASSQSGFAAAARNVQPAASSDGSLPSGPQATSPSTSAETSVPPVSSVSGASKIRPKTVTSAPCSTSTLGGHCSRHQSTGFSPGHASLAAPGVPRSPAP